MVNELQDLVDQIRGATPDNLDALLERIRKVPLGEKFLQEQFPDLRSDTPSSPKPIIPPVENNLSSEEADLLKRRVPSIRTQAQLDLAALVFESATMVLECYFLGNKGGAEGVRASLNKALDIAPRVAHMASVLEDEPEAANSEAANTFKTIPKGFSESVVLEELLRTLEEVSNTTELGIWYRQTSEVRSRITNPGLRELLYQAIRKKSS